MIRQFVRTIRRRANLLGNRHTCYICGKTFHHFLPYHGGNRNVPEFRRRLEMVGSDVDNCYCPACGCMDRERHLLMYFDKLWLWSHVRGAQILHFAPEPHFAAKVQEKLPCWYAQGDLEPKSPRVKQMDATAIPFNDGVFDVLIANHILEHIVSYPKALREFYRVLRPGGMAIVQTLYSRRLWANFEDEGIDTPELRRFFYGEADHVRIFGEFGLFYYFEDAGFRLDIRRHFALFDDGTAARYGVNEREDLILAWKEGDHV